MHAGGEGEDLRNLAEEIGGKVYHVEPEVKQKRRAGTCVGICAGRIVGGNAQPVFARKTGEPFAGGVGRGGIAFLESGGAQHTGHVGGARDFERLGRVRGGRLLGVDRDAAPKHLLGKFGMLLRPHADEHRVRFLVVHHGRGVGIGPAAEQPRIPYGLLAVQVANARKTRACRAQIGVDAPGREIARADYANPGFIH